MYRIRLESGEEAVFRTVEELAQAVSSGVVSETAEVFHKAGNRWLPINTHPDYRAVVTGKRPALPDLTDEPAATPLEPEPDRTPLPAPRRAPSAAHLEEVAPEFVDLVAQGSPEGSDPFESVPRPRRRNPPIWQALLVGLAGLLLGVSVVVAPTLLRHRPGSSAAAEDLGPTPPSTPRLTDSLGPPPTPQGAPLPTAAADTTPAPLRDTVAISYPAPSKPLAPPGDPGSRPPPRRAPGVVSRMTGTVSRMPSYFEAYADARAEMDESLAYVDFRQVFAPFRFSSPDSLRAARRMVQAAGNILRVYRGREVMLEQTYRPDNPDARGSLRESFEASEAGRSLVSDVDSLFGLLLAQQGEYSLRGTTLAFQNRRAARAYLELRGEIAQAVAAWRDSAEAPDRVTMPRLLRAIGALLPPPAR